MHRQGGASCIKLTCPTLDHGRDRAKATGWSVPLSGRPIKRRHRLSLCLRTKAQQPDGDGEEHGANKDRQQSDVASLAPLAEKVRVAKLQNVAVGRLRRRASMRSAMNFAVALRGEPEDEKKGDKPAEAPKKKKNKEEAAKEDVQSAIAATAFAVAVGATVLRVGGRAALLSVAGLDFMQETGLKDQVDQAIAYADELGSLKLVVFAGAWCLTKVACLDAIGIVLAISSGILFGGVWQGGAISAACATLGSVAAFGLGRTVLRDRVAPQVEKRPTLRAVERAVSNDGFKTVLTLRLSPLLPIPLGMYSYIYGASTSLTLPDFVAGTFIASLKPYTLDAYLGMFAKSIVDGDPGDNDAVLLGTFAVVVLVGTLASQIATRTWEEVQAELALEKADGDGEDQAEPEDGFAWMGFFGQERDAGLRLHLNLAWERLWRVLEMEHAAATLDLPRPPEVPRGWAELGVPPQLQGCTAEEADELYRQYLLEAGLAWIVTLNGITQFSRKDSLPLPLQLSLDVAQRAVAERAAGSAWPAKQE